MLLLKSGREARHSTQRAKGKCRLRGRVERSGYAEPTMASHP